MRLILSQACQLLAEYVEYGLCETDPRVVNGINLAIERLLPTLNPDKTIGRYQFDLINSMITCPREVKTILAASTSYAYCTGFPACGGGPACTTIYDVKSRWYEMLPGGPRGFLACAPNILMDLGTGYSTFADCSSDEPYTLQLYADLPQATSEGMIVINGLDADGNNLVSYENNQWIPGMTMAIPIQGQNYTQSTLAVSQIVSVNKPQTVGRLRLYGVDANGNQTALAVWQPEELNPDYRRYLVSWPYQDSPVPPIITCLCKRRFYWVTNQYEDLLITNVGALQNALMGIKFEKAGAFDQAGACWRTAIAILDQDTKDLDGEMTAVPTMQECFCAGDIWNLH
jgi:hypothetical protein